MSARDFFSGIVITVIIGFVLIGIFLSVYTYPWWGEADAEFFCDSMNKDVLSFEYKGGMLTKVVCIPKKELNPDVNVFRVKREVSG